MARLLGDLPRLFPRPEQTIAGIGRLLRQGEVTCVDILNAGLEQVDEWEPKVRAWAVLDRDGAMQQARALDEELRSGRDRGPLHGIPIGIKGIFSVKGLRCACGAKRWADEVDEQDADIVANLREAGAVIMGKTVSTPYAWIDPPPTRNPWNLERTPGGSSSGSAAAVACGMCYGAIGTQTGGSITRPASFCGIAGMKPGRLLSMHFSGGVLPFAPSLDHFGPMARTTHDLLLILCAMDEKQMRRLAKLNDESPRTTPPRLVRFRGFFDRRAEPSMRSMLEESVIALASLGAEIVDIDDPGDFDQVVKDHRRVMAAEAANVHSGWLDEFPDDYPPRITDLILEGRSLSALEYLRAQTQQVPFKNRVRDLLGLGHYDAAITPATVGTAPDPSTTGDPAFNSPWSFTGLPTVSFPVGLADDGMPLALQFVGYDLHDSDLLSTAAWCENAIRTSRQ
jgi:Asp-tRNA(Asn)/Glu-tRNA(Gln) amidotransferase A subunit family amidase